MQKKQNPQVFNILIKAYEKVFPRAQLSQLLLGARPGTLSLVLSIFLLFHSTTREAHLHVIFIPWVQLFFCVREMVLHTNTAY